MRVYELAKELDIPSKDLVSLLKARDVDCKSHMSKLDDEALELVRGDMLGEIKAAAAKAGEEAESEAKAKADADAAEKKAAKDKAKADAEAEAAAKAAAKAEADASEAAEKDAAEAKAKEEAEAVARAEQEAKDMAAAEEAALEAEIAAEEAGASGEGEAVVVEEEESRHGPDVAAQPANLLKFKGPIIVKDLALQLGMRPNRLISELMQLNVLASINERLDVVVATKIARKHGFILDYEKKTVVMQPKPKPKNVEDEEEKDADEDMVPRPPVVTFLGHVDHGKTSLLDSIREAQVAGGEAGGITQHIGAYSVETPHGQITFLDTPGHQAFTEMRARGANMTDLAVIIVAADDGIMPQTREAIQHAKAADVSIMVAINKIDLPGANVDNVKVQLQEVGLMAEDWGGETICCPVSAITGEGIPALLEMILLQIEVLELKANPDRKATGFVIESRLEKGMGPTATLLVTKGTLTLGDTIFCSPYYGRTKALINDRGAKVKSAGPSTPVQALGLNGVPEPGTRFRVFANERAAKTQAAKDTEVMKQEKLATPKLGVSITDLFAQLDEQEKLVLKLIIKADVQGSVEAIIGSLMEIKSEKISLDIILSGTGNVTANDANLAAASGAIILAFNVGVETGVNKIAKHRGVEINLHSIIYELIDQVTNAMLGMLEPETQEVPVGRAEIRAVFDISKGGRVAGCMVVKGYIGNAYRARLVKGGETVFEGKLASLRRFQTDVNEVREGQECGLRLDNYHKFDEGDVIEFYDIKSVEQTL